MQASAPVLKVKASSPAATGWKASKYVIVNGFLLLCAIAGFYLLILKKDVVIVGDTGISEQMVLTTSTIHKTNDSSSRSTDSNDNKESNDNNNDNENKDAISEGCKIQCEQKEKEKNDRMDHFNGYDLLNSNDLLQTVQKEKQKYLDKLKILYGPENYENMFYETVDGKKISRSRIIFQSPNGRKFTTSWDRFTRKLIIKILSVQKKIIQQQEEEQHVDGGQQCDCSSLSSNWRKNTLRRGAGLDEPQQQQQEEEPQSRNRRKVQSNNNSKEDYTYEKYVFATGGHSAAAGHGNLYDESYTAVMEQNVKDIFRSIGIQFEARQYAMGGTQSGSEVSLCIDSLFGIDVDTLVWDFGMTDGNDNWMEMLYLYHTGLNGIFEQQTLSIRNDDFYAGMPTSITFGEDGGRLEVLKHMENDCAMSALFFDSKTRQKVMDVIPDTLGKTDEEILNMPLNVRYFKCNDQIEAGEPYCGEKKYNDTICPHRQYKAGWHPGWKVHSLHGQLLSLLFMEALEDAVNYIKDQEAGLATKRKIQEIYDPLNKQDMKDQNRFLSSSVPMDRAKRILITNENGNGDNVLRNNKYFYEDLITMIYKSHSFCHIASLPSDIRYRGILTEKHSFENLDGSSINSRSSLQRSPMTKQQQQFSLFPNGEYNENSGKFFYDIGLGRQEMDSLLEQKNSSETEQQQADSIIQIVYDERFRQNCVNATYLNVDYKDYFFIHHKSKWSTITVPNDEEIKYYNIHTTANDDDNNNRLKGLIMFCGVKCDWNICPEGEIGIGGLNANNANNELASVEINGQPVKEFLDVGKCTVLMKERAKDSNSTSISNLFSSHSTSTSSSDFFSSYYLWVPDPDTGKYNFRIKVNKPDSYFRMSSIIII